MDYGSAAEYWIQKDKSSIKMQREELFGAMELFIEEHNTCALATGAEDFVRCTPIEYNYVDGAFYLLSEGGLKFRALRDNKNVCLAIFEPYSGFGHLKGMQVSGKADMVEPFTEEYNRLLGVKKIPLEAIRKLPQPLHLIKITPVEIDYLNSDFKKDGFDSRQQLKFAD
jgi:general stress protein 26